MNKAYNDLYIDIYLDILTVYIMGLWYICLLRRYWDLIIMVEKSGGYYGTPLKGYRGVKHGVPLSPHALKRSGGRRDMSTDNICVSVRGRTRRLWEGIRIGGGGDLYC